MVATMKRSLRRRIMRAAYETWNPDREGRSGEVTVLIEFPPGAFSDAPRWSPGADFRLTCEEYAWLRNNGNGTLTAVVARVVGPPSRPEVWTVTAPEGGHDFSWWDMGHKPYRIARLRHDPRAVIHRETYADHPIAAVHAYWEAFEKEWGFSPVRTIRRGENLFPDGRWWTVLHAIPGHPKLPNLAELLRATTLICRTFGARARVYGERARRGAVRDVRYAATSPTLGCVVRVRRLACRR